MQSVGMEAIIIWAIADYTYLVYPGINAITMQRVHESTPYFLAYPSLIS